MAESDSFTRWLRERSEPDWTAVVTHPFTDALFDGSISEANMRSYLVQDYQFVDEFLALLGAALAKADRYTSRLTIAASITVVTSDTNTYFQRAFDELEVPESDRHSPKTDDITVAFRDLMSDTNTRGGYAEALTLLTVAEWTYLEWALRAPGALPANFVHSEWVGLHNNPEFRRWVDWLCAELDRIGADLDERDKARCLRLFQRATRYELDFFNAHWG